MDFEKTILDILNEEEKDISILKKMKKKFDDIIKELNRTSIEDGELKLKAANFLDELTDRIDNGY